MIFCSGLSSKITSPGLELSIYGGFFDVRCSVYFGNTAAVVETASEDKLDVVVPDISGIQIVTVQDGSGNVVRVGEVSVGDFSDVPVYNYVRDNSADDFKADIHGFFPRGQLFDFENGSNWTRFVAGLGAALLYIWGLIRSLLEAINPLSTTNFDEWERELGLPEIGISPETAEGRRREIYRVGFAKGGCSINYYKKILALMKIDADIFEYNLNPEKFADVDFTGKDPRYYMMIRFRVPVVEYDYFRAGDSVAGDRVMDFSDYRVEAVFERLKQAHVNIIYSYMTMRDMQLVTSQGFKLVTSAGARIVAFTYPE